MSSAVAITSQMSTLTFPFKKMVNIHQLLSHAATTVVDYSAQVLEEAQNGEAFATSPATSDDHVATSFDSTSYSNQPTSKSSYVPKHAPDSDPYDLNLLGEPYGYASAYYCFGSNEENFLSLEGTINSSDAGEVVAKVTRGKVHESVMRGLALGGDEVIDGVRIGAYNLAILTRNIVNEEDLTPYVNCYMSGKNEQGQFGRDNSFTGTSRFVKIDFFEKRGIRLANVAFGSYFTMFLSDDGRLFGCGENENGQMGTDILTPQYEILQIKLFDNNGEEEQVVQVEAGAFHCAILTKSGNIYTQGYNCWGRLNACHN